MNICQSLKMNVALTFSIPKDLCMIEHIPGSLLWQRHRQHEDRGKEMKTALYVATVARTATAAGDG